MKHKTNTISRRTGTEGPRHDPYSYEEITVKGRNGTTTVHLGLAEWIQNNKEKRMEGYKFNLDYEFQKLTGISIRTAERLYETRPWRAHARKCSGRETRTESGYPGETFTVCTKCGEVINSRFNASAIE